MGHEFANILMPLGMCTVYEMIENIILIFQANCLFFFKGSMIHHDKIMQKEDLIVFTEKPLITKGSDTEAQHQTGVSMCCRLKVSWVHFSKS